MRRPYASVAGPADLLLHTSHLPRPSLLPTQWSPGQICFQETSLTQKSPFSQGESRGPCGRTEKPQALGGRHFWVQIPALPLTGCDQGPFLKSRSLFLHLTMDPTLSLWVSKGVKGQCPQVPGGVQHMVFDKQPTDAVLRSDGQGARGDQKTCPKTAFLPQLFLAIGAPRLSLAHCYSLPMV